MRNGAGSADRRDAFVSVVVQSSALEVGRGNGSRRPAAIRAELSDHRLSDHAAGRIAVAAARRRGGFGAAGTRLTGTSYPFTDLTAATPSGSLGIAVRA